MLVNISIHVPAWDAFIATGAIIGIKSALAGLMDYFDYMSQAADYRCEI